LSVVEKVMYRVAEVPFLIVMTCVELAANVALLAVPVNVPLTVKLGTTSVVVPGL
jgi:hypothetical protein